MTDLLENLFTYACEHPIGHTKEDHMQSAIYAQAAEKAKEELKRLLPEDGQRQLADYIRAESQLQQLELESLFRAGLSIGLELSRLSPMST